MKYHVVRASTEECNLNNAGRATNKIRKECEDPHGEKCLSLIIGCPIFKLKDLWKGKRSTVSTNARCAKTHMSALHPVLVLLLLD